MFKLLCEEFGDQPISAITTRQIDGYLSRRADQDGISACTYNRYLSTLKTVFKQAQAWNYIGFNPAESIRIRKEEQKIPEACADFGENYHGFRSKITTHSERSDAGCLIIVKW